MTSTLQRLRTYLIRTACQRLYLGGIAGIRMTAALRPGHLPYSLLSMVQHRDVLPYLVALKSFYAHLPARRVIVVCDPSITAPDRALLAEHVPQIVLRDAAEFVDPRIPQGGTWERLFAISEYASDDYVVQLDADTVTLGALPEVEKAIAQRHGFVIGERAAQTLETLEEVAERAGHWVRPPINSVHIQAVVEAMIADIGLPQDDRYVRGCSGFTGFPPDSSMRARLLNFSARMHQRHGLRWADWGTEQITSNYLVANAHGTKVLPFPRYGTPDAFTHSAVFMHFIGYLRFINRRYEHLSRQQIERLQR